MTSINSNRIDIVNIKDVLFIAKELTNNTEYVFELKPYNIVGFGESQKITCKTKMNGKFIDNSSINTNYRRI